MCGELQILHEYRASHPRLAALTPSATMPRMRERVLLLIYLIATVAKFLPPGGARSIIAESLLLKHQLLILNRSRARAPNLRPFDRVIAALCADLMHRARLIRAAVVLRPATLMRFHEALVKRKYRWLFAPKRRRKPGPKGPAPELVTAIVGTLASATAASLNRSLFCSVSRSTRTLCDVYSRNTVGRQAAPTVRPGSLSSDMPRTAYGALISFVVNR